MPLPVHTLRPSDPTPVTQLHLVEHRGVLTLVDTGTPGTERRVLSALRALGRRPEDLRQIVVSHAHGDHAGSAKALREATGARVVVGAGDADVARGDAPYLFPRGWARPLYGRLSKFPRFEPDVVVADRTELDGGIVAIPAPGHTPGHLAFLAPDLDTLFLGDVVWRLAGRTVGSWRAFTWDRERNLDSMRRLAGEGTEVGFVGHGPPMRRGASERVRALAEKLTSRRKG